MKDNSRKAEFNKRLDKYYNELKWLYCELYNGDEKAFDYFCSVLYEYYEGRSEKLKKLDRSREKDPGWYRKRETLGTLMYAECFADDLKGVKDHLDYLKEAGIDYLHLMPLLKSPVGKSDGGYAVSDFRAVDPRLGTMKDLSDLTDECHDRGMSVCLDFVMNHTSEEHEWAIKARQGDKDYQDRFFFFDDWNIPNEYEKTVPQVFPQTAPGNFTWCGEANKVVMTTFYPYQWDLNYHNPVVFNDMTANMLYLCNQGIDVIRLDAVPYIWKTLGTNCRNLPEVHTIVRIMRMASEIVCPGTLLLGEVVMEPKEVAPYFGTVEKPECHMLYNVTTMATLWHTVATADVRLLRHQLYSVFSLPGEYTFLNYLRCHDDIGWGLDFDFLKQFGIEEAEHKKYLNDYFRGYVYGSEARGELYNDDPRLKDARLCGTTASLCGIEAAEYEGDNIKEDRGIALDEMLHAFLFTLSGIPVLYYGDEIGMLNDYTYHDDDLKRDDSRYLHRGKFSWEDAAKRKNKKTRQGRIFNAIKSLKKLRDSYKVFEADADVWVPDRENIHVLEIGRYYEGEELVALFNFSSEATTVYPGKDEWYTDLLTGNTIDTKEILLGAYQAMFLYKQY